MKQAVWADDEGKNTEDIERAIYDILRPGAEECLRALGDGK